MPPAGDGCTAAANETAGAYILLFPSLPCFMFPVKLRILYRLHIEQVENSVSQSSLAVGTALSICTVLSSLIVTFYNLLRLFHDLVHFVVICTRPRARMPLAHTGK